MNHYNQIMKLNELAAPEMGELSDSDKLTANERIHGIDANDLNTTQRLLSLAIGLELFSDAVLDALPNIFEKRKLILLFTKFIGNRIEYCNIKQLVAAIVSRIEMLMPCGLHNCIRIPCNLLTHLRKLINERHDLTPSQRKLLGEKLEETISKSIGSGTNATFTYTYKGSMLQVVSLTCVKLVQVMVNWSSLVNVVFADLNDPDGIKLKEKWCDLGERFLDCMYLFTYKYDMTPQKISRFQLCCDLFCSRYRELVGINAETNYIQNMSAGVFRYFAAAYGSIYAYNNTVMEACAGREKDFFQKGTQHDVDGHRGKPLIEAFRDRHMIQRAMLMDRLAPGILQESVDTGKAANNLIRSEKDRAWMRKKKDMQVDNLNIVADRKVRVAEIDDNGKKRMRQVILQIGDPMPTKLKRCKSAAQLLQKHIVQNISELK